MDNRLFRDVLAECLAEKNSSAVPAANHQRPATFSLSEPFFQWRAPDLGRPKSGAYTKITAADPLAKSVASPWPFERLIPIAQLKPLDQADALLILNLGASELGDGISLKVLKKAHRRLIKKLHPDRWDQGLAVDEQRRLQDQFLQLQRAYESLSRSLTAPKSEPNGSACGSESASAPDYRRRDAA